MSSTEFIDGQLRVTSERIAEAASNARNTFDRNAENDWLARCSAREHAANVVESEWPLMRLQLTATEHRVLWVLVAQELDPAARAHLRELATESEVDVSHDVLRRVVYGSRPGPACWNELSAEGALRTSCLIDAIDGSNVPNHRTTFRISNRVLALVHGDEGLDRELVGLVGCPPDMPTCDAIVVDAASRARIRASLAADNTGITIVVGPAGSGRRSLITAVVRDAGHDVIAIDAREIDRDPAIAGRQLRILARECRLFDRLPLLLNVDALGATDEIQDRLALVEAHVRSPLVFATSTRLISRRWTRTPTVVELAPLTGTERAEVWKRALPEASAGDADLLSTMYPLAPALITAVGKVARAEARGVKLEPRHISIGIRRALDNRLAGLATRINVTQDWKDLVLPEDQTLAVVELLARVRARRRVYEDWGFAEKVSRGLGVAVLFSGPPGTGKTMCASLIAKDLGTELYQVDLGKIVSKWVGETEKNLAALFDAAEASHAVLLFDEADSLFGKRTAVTSANDRYANQETNFLLQRIETFAGICILTTNHDPAIDEAFRRRLSVHVRFPMPDEEEREKLWHAMLPASAPVDADLEVSTLAKKFVMAGGHIRNAVLRAAFLAADANEAIGNYHLRQAAQLEYEGMGKLAVRAS